MNTNKMNTKRNVQKKITIKYYNVWIIQLPFIQKMFYDLIKWEQRPKKNLKLEKYKLISLL